LWQPSTRCLSVFRLFGYAYPINKGCASSPFHTYDLYSTPLISTLGRRLLAVGFVLAALPVMAQPVTTGAQRLVNTDFAALDTLPRPQPGPLHVGLVTNHTALVDSADGGPLHLIDRLDAAPNMTLDALFGPEHGLRGTAEAGAAVESGRDTATGVPVYSLYGASKKPPPESLDGLDALVFDMQDIGARFYTYISTMGYAMQAAAEAGIPFVVLDRPNPLGGRVGGFVLESEFASFIGLYPIPIQHGFTTGELAQMIAGEGWLPGLGGLDLRVVGMEGWNRSMLWSDTELPWTPTSPNIPDFETALVYPGIALFEGTVMSEGRGTASPFLVVGAPWLDGVALADTLCARELPGVRFEAAHFTPRSIPGVAANPKFEDEAVEGVRIIITDADVAEPVALGIHLLHASYQQVPHDVDFFDSDWLAKLAGTRRLQKMLEHGATPEQIVAAWQDDVTDFEHARRPYLLYE